jgi:thiol-disulfide isomerase/thioredoxin
MTRPKAIAFTLLVICTLFIVTAGFITGAPSTIVVKDLDGVSRTFFSGTSTNAKTLVFIFVLPDCPVCNSYAPELKRLRGAFPQIEFYLVYADTDVAMAEARQHSRDYDFGFPGLLDPAQRLVRGCGATRAPEAAVLSPQGKLLYRGRIDDRYFDFGKKRDRPGQRDLENALRSILQNKTALWPDKPPVGCFIPIKS